MDADPGDEPTPATDLPATEPAEPAEPAQPARQGEDEQWERLRRVLVFAAWCLAVAAAGLVAAAVVQVDQFGRGSRVPVSVADRFVLLGQSVGPTIGMLAVGGGLLLTGVRALYAVPAKGAISLGLVVAVVVGGVGAGVDLVALAVRAAGWASQQLQRQQGAVGVLVESTGFLVGLAAVAVGAAGLRLETPPSGGQAAQSGQPAATAQKSSELSSGTA